MSCFSAFELYRHAILLLTQQSVCKRLLILTLQCYPYFLKLQHYSCMQPGSIFFPPFFLSSNLEKSKWPNQYFPTLWHMHKFVFFFLLFRATPMAYGGSQSRGWIRATAAGLCHSHSNARSEPRLWPTPQLMATSEPSPNEWGQGSNPQLRGSRTDSFPLCHKGNSTMHHFIISNICHLEISAHCIMQISQMLIQFIFTIIITHHTDPGKLLCAVVKEWNWKGKIISKYLCENCWTS